MYFVVRRTWLAGADPGGEPDVVKTVAKAVSREAADARAAALASVSKRACMDADQGVWLCKAPDALHTFQVCSEDGPADADERSKGGVREVLLSSFLGNASA